MSDKTPIRIKESDALKCLAGLVPVGIFWKDADRRFLGCNQMFLDYYGLSSVNDIIGKTDEDMGWHIDPEPYRSVELQVIECGETIKNVPGQCIVKGKVRDIRASKMPLYMDGRIVGLVGYFVDLTEEIARIERLTELSTTDELTGLLNRRAYAEIAQKFESQFQKDNTDFVLFMIDLDEFKAINDEYGHEFGNTLLKSVSRSLTDASAADSVLFRYGGDEFVILHQYRSKSEIGKIQKRLLAAAESPRNIEGTSIHLRASIGHAVYSETQYMTSLIEQADKAMYRMKDEHRQNK